MTVKEYTGLTAASGDTRAPATVTVLQDYDRPIAGQYVVTVEFDGHVFRGESSDAFWAFAKARDRYEPRGWRLAVQGASVNCFPSGMQGDAGGLWVYRHPRVMGESPLVAVETFAPAALDEIGMVSEQKAAHRARMEERGAASPRRRFPSDGKSA